MFTVTGSTIVIFAGAGFYRFLHTISHTFNMDGKYYWTNLALELLRHITPFLAECIIISDITLAYIYLATIIVYLLLINNSLREMA